MNNFLLFSLEELETFHVNAQNTFSFFSCPDPEGAFFFILNNPPFGIYSTNTFFLVAFILFYLLREEIVKDNFSAKNDCPNYST